MTRSGPSLACALLVGAACALAACGESPSAEGQAAVAQAPPAPGADQVVAEVGGRRITLRDVDEKWAASDAAERNRLTQQLYEGRRTALDELVADVLIEQAARAAGRGTDEWAAAELARRTEAVTEADIREFYEQNKARAQGRSFDELRGIVKDFLDGQRRQQARASLVAELKAKGTAVRVLLDPPRLAVEVAAADPALGDPAAPVTLVEFSDYQ